MAKILGYNKLYKTQYKTSCDKCGAIVLFDEKEISNEYQYNEYCYSKGICPSCGCNICFDKDECKYTEECSNQEYINIYNQTVKIDDIYSSINAVLSSTTDSDGWPTDITNCPRNCKECFGKCLYRKEKNPNQ